MKTITWIILTVLLASSVMAEPTYEACKSTTTLNQNCTIITPHLLCDTYTYDIININGTITETDNLIELNQSNYYLTFTQGQGDYLVRLCDNTTREISVIEGENMDATGFIIIAPLLLSIIFIAGAATMSPKHAALKIFLFILSIVPFFASMHFALLTIIKFYNWTEMQSAIGTTIWWVGITIFVILIYFLIYWLWSLAKNAMKQKQDELEY